MRVCGVIFGLCAIVIPAIVAVPVAYAQAPQQMQPSGAIDFDLPSGSLAETLVRLGAHAHVNIVFSPDMVAGKRTRVLKGRFSLPGALTELLSGSGLSVSSTRAGSYVIVAAKVPPPEPDRGFVPVRDQPSDETFIAHEMPALVVTGYKTSLEQTFGLKREFNGIVDSIVAEDMAKFPDSNVAEAIQRVSGIALARDQGEGRTISVRGLGPEFARTEINGIEAQASTDGLVQGANRGRGFDFNVFPSELFSRIDVRKTSSADQTEGSLGSTVALSTPRPFDRKGPRFSAAWQSSYNDLSQRAGTKMSILASHTFAGDRFGVLLSAAYAYSPLELQGVHSGGWNQGTANGGFCKPTAGTGGICDVPLADLAASLEAYARASEAGTRYPQFYRYTHQKGSIKRLGVTTSLQWRPSDRTLITLDGLYSRYETHRTDYFLEGIGFSRGASQGGKPEIVPRRVELDDNGTMLYGLFDNVDVRSEVGVDDFSTDFVQASLQVRQQLTPDLVFDGVIGRSSSRFDNATDIMVQIDRPNVDGYAFDIRGGGQGYPAITYGFDLTDSASWYFGPRVTQAGGTGASGPEIRVRPNFTRNGYETFKAKLTYGATSALRASLGAEVKRYTFDAISYRFDAGEADFAAPVAGLAGMTNVFCGLGTISPPAGTPRCWRVPDIDAFVEAYDIYAHSGRTALSTTNVAARGSNQSVDEKDTSVFAQLSFRQMVSGRLVRGDIGIRSVETDQRSMFYTNVPTPADPAAFVLTHAGRTYRDDLPSLNLAWDVNERSVLRFSAAKVMARPPLSSIAAATNVTVSGSRRTVMTGNPNLKPYRATSFDVSYEIYRSPGNMASIGLFYKDVSTYIQSVTRIAPYATTGLPASLLANTGVTEADEFSISNIVNTPGGPIRGIELNYNATLDKLSPALTGFGFMINYTMLSSKIKYFAELSGVVSIVRDDVLNLSRGAYGSTLYYDRGPLQARLSVSSRDKYLTSVPGSFGSDVGGVDASAYWDCSVNYRPRPGLVVSFEGQNLTNERTLTWDNSRTRLLAGYQLSGRQFSLGVRYTY